MKLLICNKCFDEKQRKIIAEAFHHCTEWLGIDQIKKTIVIHDHQMDRENGGFGPYPDKATEQQIIKGEVIDRYLLTLVWNPKKWLDVFCHEMVHAEQWVTGRQKACLARNGIYKSYHGVPVDPKTPYRDQPWEIDAYRRGPQLERYVRSRLSLA